MNKVVTGACMVIVIAYCLSACSNNGVDYDASLKSTDSLKPLTVIPGPLNPATPDTILGGGSQLMASPMVPPAVNQATLATTAAGMNPAHGQPNHRCDIAVGAPLNSPAPKPGINPVSTTNNPTVTTTSIPAQASAKTVVPAGMNPQHGEPGHRCDIAVGAPLNSPVVKSSAPAPVIVPAKKDSGS